MSELEDAALHWVREACSGDQSRADRALGVLCAAAVRHAGRVGVIAYPGATDQAVWEDALAQPIEFEEGACKDGGPHGR